MHYRRFMVYGDPHFVKRDVNRTPLERFASFCAEPTPGTGCIEWTGTCMGTGYGLFHGDGKMRPAHRWIYETTHGPVGDLEIDHLCRNRGCVNLDHLEAVTHKENMRRARAAWTHCRNGHPITEENTYVIPKTGGRTCKACRTLAVRRTAAKKARLAQT